EQLDLRHQVAGRDRVTTDLEVGREEGVLAPEGPRMQDQIHRVSILHQGRRLQQLATRVPGNDEVLVRAYALRIGGDLGEACWLDQIRVGARVTARHEVERLACRVDELHERQVRHRPHALEVADFE